MRRFFFVVLDGVGVGALPDAEDYGDTGSDTLGNTARITPIRLPFLERAGLGNIIPLRGVPPVEDPLFMPGRLAPHSRGKDTTVGHWEHMGLITAEPFPTYPDGFPDEVIHPFTDRIGRQILGNRTASGTAIIDELGEEHLATGRPIVYTSADSVFQIAAHVDVVSLDELYAWCLIARQVLRGRHSVARVIARPFRGTVGAFVRTKERRDFSLEPPEPTYLDLLHDGGVPVVGLGKISEIFGGRGVSRQIKVASNEENLAVLSDLVHSRNGTAPFEHGLAMTNLVDFDMLWGHRNDVDGFAQGLAVVDEVLPRLVEGLRCEDLLLLTADHGVDPTTPSTDHSREYVPLLLYPRPENVPDAVYEGGFADAGATAYEFLTGRRAPLAGTAVTALVPERGWRGYTAVIDPGVPGAPQLPVRLGPSEPVGASLWLERELGAAPDAAVVVGSGLLPDTVGRMLAEVPYQNVPLWVSGNVPGHAYVLTVVDWAGRRIALLRGRIHDYEGYDMSEVQLAVRSLADWKVANLILTSASGAVAEDLSAGEVVAIDGVLEPEALAQRGSEHGPGSTPCLTTDTPDLPGLRRGVHVSLPGPQYETPAELRLLRRLGATTVSMSPAAELRAAREQGMRVAVLAVVANAGDTTHEEVLRSGATAAQALAETIERVLEGWEVPASLYYGA